MSRIQKATQQQALTKKDTGGGLNALIDKSWDRIQAVLPSHMSPERMYQLAISTVNQTPKLADCAPETILGALMKCSAMGLEPSNVDGQGHVHIIPRRIKGRMEATVLIGYQGYLELMDRTGSLKSRYPRAVYEGDEFDYWEDETGQHFKYRMNPEAERTPDKLQYVYFAAQFTNGGSYFEIMSRKEVEEVRKVSQMGNTGAWKDWYESMALKSVIRKAAKYMPKSIRVAVAAAEQQEEADYIPVVQGTAPRPIFPELTESPETGGMVEADIVGTEDVDGSVRATCKACGTETTLAPDVTLEDLPDIACPSCGAVGDMELA